MDEDINKNRRINSETEQGDSDDMLPESPDSQPDTKLMKLDDDMLDSMNKIDRKILAAAILGVDITKGLLSRTGRKGCSEIWSPSGLIF